MLRIFLLGIVAFFLSTPVRALEMPARPAAHVNDYASLLTASEKAQLEERLRKFEEDTSSQIVIAMFPALGGEDIEDFSNRLFEKWQIGQKNKNNGILLAVFLEERKVRIEVGYGLEGALTDAMSGEIIRNEIAPAFREGRHAEGLTAAVNAIEQATRGEYRAKSPPQQPANDYLPLLVFLIFVFLIFMSRMRRNRGIFLPDSRYHRQSNFPIFLPGSDDRWGGGGGWGGSSGGGGGGFSGGGGLSGGGGASGSW